MPGNDTINKLATVLAVSGSAYLAGFTSSLSVLAVPVLPLAPPSLATKQWAGIYTRGAALGPPMGLSSLFLFAYLALAHSASKADPKGLAFALAGLCAGANMPWTLLTMLPTNSALQAIANEPAATTAEIEKDAVRRERRAQEVKRLLGKWSRLNAVRSVGPTLGALLGGAVAVDLI
ncbi:DUF1772-domain-containing protein [Calocera viscosa TUFC12733]|uniref:DUF1772-domain-containing protein n=1 Tax=Calocera viscosa (strain TUFC12733) TaxID=1330018 RepID=A0A167Q1B9_CALVF|nr:DUF1772-domain-containing protein [Calocera viscosa TUFC12733]